MGNGLPAGDGAARPHKTSVWIERPDLLVFRPVGMILPEHLRDLTAQKQQLRQEAGYTFTLLDLSLATGVALETRRVARTYAGMDPARAVAIYGASYHLTVLASALTRGVHALLKLKRPVRFFRTEEDARAWLSELRSAC